jgi:DNA-binding MarR family transcriptional regulator
MSDDRQRLINEIEDVFQGLAWRNQHQLAVLLGRHGLTIPQFVALAVLQRFGPEMTMREIGEMIQAPPSSMTSIVDRHEQRGLIQRRPHPTDRRATLARITDAGLELLTVINDERHQALVNALDDVPMEDLSHFLATLRQISAKFEATTEVSLEAGMAEANERG